MKKVISFLAVILVAAFPATAQVTEPDATKIIDMTNHVVDMYNSYLPNLKRASRGLKAAEQGYMALSENMERTVSSWDCVYTSLRLDYKANFEKAAAAAPSFPEKASILSGIKYIEDNTQRLGSSCKALKDYFANKEYKKDTDWERYGALYRDMEAAYTDLLNIWSIAIKLATEAGDRSELVLLAKSPIAEFVIPMKADLSLATKLLGYFSEEEIDSAAILRDVEVLKKAIEKNKSLTGKNISNLEKYSNKATYEGFYVMMEELVALISSLERLVNPTNTMDEDERNQQIENIYAIISYKYNSLVESYNAM